MNNNMKPNADARRVGSPCRGRVRSFLLFCALAQPVAVVAPPAWAQREAPGASIRHQKAMDGGRLSLKRFQKPPKLVVVIVIDQFRADYLTRFSSRFLPARQTNGDVGGFQYLMEQGAYFPAARYDVLQSMTCPGHAMIMSGSYPYLNGISLNEWYDPKRGQITYCAYDQESPIIGEATAKDEPVSPRPFQGTTVGDELKNAGYPSRTISIALKDRAAVYLGGHRADETVWFSRAYRWVTSKYYARAGKLPPWASELNRAIAARIGQPYRWPSFGKATGYSGPAAGMLGETTKIGTYESLRTPLGADLMTDAAIAALKAHKLGAGPGSDVLTLGYSAHDFLGHDVGPNALEMEEMTIGEDRSLARLFNEIRKSTPGGLANVVIALTADHGVAPEERYLKAGRIDSGTLNRERLLEAGESALRAKHGKAPKGKWIAALQSFNFYLDTEALAAKREARAEVEATLKKALLGIPGVAFVFTRSEREAGRLPPGQHARQIQQSFVDGRNGDVVLIPKAFYAEDGHVATHMTGYAYDRSVPLVIAGPGLKRGVYGSQADVIDLAPTLSFLLGTIPPALSEGRVLAEALGD